MKTMLKSLAFGLAPMTAIAIAAAPAAAQSKQGIAVVDLQRAVATSAAYTNARTQMQTTYKPQIDAFNARKAAIDADLKTKGEALQAALRAANNKPTPALETQYQQFQVTQQNAQTELQRLGTPINNALGYVEEQIGAKVSDALKAAMTKAKVDLILTPDATVSFQPSVDITQSVVNELNTLVPNVSITPPAGWRPGGQQGQQPAAAAPAPAAASPAQKPSSR